MFNVRARSWWLEYL